MNVAEAAAALVEAALKDHKHEAALRLTHRLALKRLQSPNAEYQHDFATWSRQERNAWLLVQALNERIASRRADIVYVDPEDLDEDIARLERQVAAEENL